MLKGVIYKLLDEKWKTFGRFNFFVRLAFFLLYLAVLTTAFYLRPGKVCVHEAATKVTVPESHNYMIDYTPVVFPFLCDIINNRESILN